MGSDYSHNYEHHGHTSDVLSRKLVGNQNFLQSPHFVENLIFQQKLVEDGVHLWLFHSSPRVERLVRGRSPSPSAKRRRQPG
jgi:hypothetical protein